MNLTTTDNADRLDREGDLPRLGEWYWIKSTADHSDPSTGRQRGDAFEWLGCVMGIGSNYVQVQAPPSRNGYYSIRIHIDDIDARMRLEPNAEAVIADEVAKHQNAVNALIAKVGEVTRALGLRDTPAISADSLQQTESRAVATLSDQADVKAYEAALARAKEETLPDLFRQIERWNEELSTWMKAGTLPLQARISPLKQAIGQIDDRIFSISLYAGLTEEAVLCSDGKPADMTDKLCVMQRLCFMDEECLANYSAGGMDFREIDQFDEWIAVPENRDRIMPFPRTLVAMRVRRHEKDREWVGGRTNRINVALSAVDKTTFLYCRNGEQVWRISCEMDFGDLLFPDKADFDPSEPMMLKTFGDRFDKLMPVREYEWRMEQWNEAKRLSEQWAKDNPDQSWIRNPYGGGVGDYRMDGMETFNPREWKRLDFSNVHYDEAMDHVARQIREYNRIALIIQGLFDRSGVLHPHPPVKSWTQEGFDRAISLIYDGNATLYDGERPDFEAYRARLNASLGVGSVVTGQDEYWMRAEAAKENRKVEDNPRVRDKYAWKRYRPQGNPGPGTVGVISEWRPRKRQAVFRWRREKAFDFGTTESSLAVPHHALLNVSAYVPGDYKQFFRDPRTRADYIEWAPLLLAAEDYHAGRIDERDLELMEQARLSGIPVPTLPVKPGSERKAG